LTNAINKVSKVADGNIGLESHQILKLLLDYEARVDIVNSNGFYPIMSALKAKNYDAVIILLPHYDNLDEVSFTFDGLKIPFPFMVARNGIPLIMKAVLSKEPQWCNYHLDNGDSLSDWANNQEMKELIESFGKCY
jgi:ankyrin repeat protein